MPPVLLDPKGGTELQLDGGVWSRICHVKGVLARFAPSRQPAGRRDSLLISGGKQKSD